MEKRNDNIGDQARRARTGERSDTASTVEFCMLTDLRPNPVIDGVEESRVKEGVRDGS